MQLKLKDLLAVNPDADLKRIGKYTALYEGGSAFELYKDQFIIKRQLECGGEGALSGAEHFKERKKRAQYINRCSGVINWVVSTATKDNPMIATDATEESDIEFYSNLNKDTDGSGTPFNSLVRLLFTQMLVKQYPYLEVRAEGEATKDDWKLNVIDSSSVLDYDIDDNNEVKWIKTHTRTAYRETTYGAADGIQNIVTLYTEDATFGFVFYGKEGEYKDVNGNPLVPEDTVNSNPECSVESHQFGTNPVFRGNSTSFHFVMDRLSEPLKALYNAEIDLAFALATNCYPQLYLKLEDSNRVNQIIKDELSIILLMVTEDIGYVSPGTQAFESLFKNIDRLKSALTESMRMMSSEAAELPQAGRLSGEAVKQMRSPLESMISALSYPVQDVLMSGINAIREVRGDTFNIWIENFGDVAVEEGEIKELEEELEEEKELEEMVDVSDLQPPIKEDKEDE